jgi:hypothetical protein
MLIGESTAYAFSADPADRQMGYNDAIPFDWCRRSSTSKSMGPSERPTVLKWAEDSHRN